MKPELTQAEYETARAAAKYQSDIITAGIVAEIEDSRPDMVPV